jgi:prepilin peptidase CpaA
MSVISVVGALAIITDVLRRKIYNALTIPAMALGILTFGWTYGLTGLGQSLGGILTGLACFALFFGLRWLGAGDVKLLMAFGAWGGARFSANVALLSIVLGGIMAFLALLVTGRLWGFLKRFYFFARSFVIQELEPEQFRADRTFRLPFAIPLSLAAFFEATGNPMATIEQLSGGIFHG